MNRVCRARPLRCCGMHAMQLDVRSSLFSLPPPSAYRAELLGGPLRPNQLRVKLRAECTFCKLLLTHAAAITCSLSVPDLGYVHVVPTYIHCILINIAVWSSTHHAQTNYLKKKPTHCIAISAQVFSSCCGLTNLGDVRVVAASMRPQLQVGRASRIHI